MFEKSKITSPSILDDVKTALRIKGTNLYDDELKAYIGMCFYDLKRLNVFFDEDNPEPEIRTAVITYVKSQFGTTDVNYKESMRSAYQSLRLLLYLDSSHKG